MADEQDPNSFAGQADEAPPPPVARRRRRWPFVTGIVVAILFIGMIGAWLARERIVGNVIDGELAKLDLPVTYEIVSIGKDNQVLRNVVIGDPRRPDLTVEQVEVATRIGWSSPRIGRITLTKPRLYGTFRDGKPSFGSLDKVLFTGSKEPFRLPDLDIAIRDGRGLLETGYGPVGVKVEGEGALRDGFSGTLAAVAAGGSIANCQAERASLYGRVSIAGEVPAFSGPLRLKGLACGDGGPRLAEAAVQVDANVDQRFDGGEGTLALVTGAGGMDDNRFASSSGDIRFAYREGALTAHFDVAGQRVSTLQAQLSTLASKGVLRAQENFARIEVDGEASGAGLRPGDQLDAALARGAEAGKGTFAAPLLARLRDALRREGTGSRFTAVFVLRKTGEIINLLVPQGTVRGSSGQALLALSRLQVTAGGAAAPRVAGNFTTGGPGLPRLAGRMERNPAGGLSMRIAMTEYSAGGSSLAAPQLTLVQAANGALGFAGTVRMSGPLPGGEARNLTLPLDGNWSQGGGLALWRGCVPVSFDRLAMANLTLERRGLTLCPPSGSAVVRMDSRGLRIAAGTPRLDLAGRLGSTPIRIAGGPVGMAWPGQASARSLDVALGPAASASRFRIANVSARLDKEIAGKFAGTDVRLNAVPLDVLDASGDWRFANGRLTLANAAFRLEDRTELDRFQPLTGRAGRLELADNRIVASALMLEPASQREIVRADIRHNLASGVGHADLSFAGIVFDRGLQPDTLTRLALGVVANVSGTVTGSGKIDWSPSSVASSGDFATSNLDLAAMFGPVKGLSGKVHFVDLLGLVTARNQELRVASVNPGIEVNDGVIGFEMRSGNMLAVSGGHWPFMDGTLTLEPTSMTFGTAETRRYTLRIQGLNAAKFVERIQLTNISATGTFDGLLPLVFDENGGRIEKGYLDSRPPGGNVSYVGALTYKDISPMANFAFDALKSIDYRQMRVAMDGPLAGEIVTRVSFDGLSQGATAKRNFLTRRIAKLPIRFNVNLRAPFIQLITSARSLYDPAYVRDPRSLGLMGSDGKPLQTPPPGPADGIQPPVSEGKP